MSGIFRSIGFFLFGMLLAGIGLKALAQTSVEGIKVLDVSQSKKSIILDRGTIEGVSKGQRGALYLQDLSAGLNKPKYTFVADGEAIKIHSNYSYWFLRNIENYRLIKKGEKLVILRNGSDRRRKLRHRGTKSYSHPNLNIEDVKSIDSKGVPEDLIFEEDAYFPSKDLVATKSTRRHDLESRGYSKLNKKKTGEWNAEYLEELDNLHPGPISLNDTKKDLKTKTRDNVFRSTAKGSVQKVNNEKFGLEGMYADSIKRPGQSTRANDKSNSMYGKSQEDERTRTIISPRAIAKIKKEGAAFSADMDDDQLRRFFVQSGIAREVKRQKNALEQRNGHEINLRFMTGLGSYTTVDDDSHQNANYGFSASYEFHLGQTSSTLKNFTFEAELDRAVLHYDLGGINGRFTEGSFRGYAHWYFWNPPNSLGKYMIYLGAGIRRGTADVTNQTLSKDYEYQIIAMPSYRLGLKYRFKSGDMRDETVKLGFGLSFLLTSENVRLSAIDTVVDDINPVIELNQLSLGIGINVYF